MALPQESFIHQLKTCLKERKLIPMWGQIPPFPWDSLKESINHVLQADHSNLYVEKSDWTEFGDFFKGLGEDPIIISCALAPLNHPFFLAFSLDDAEHLTASLMEGHDNQKSFTDPDYTKGFFRFLLLKIFSDFNQKNPLHNLTVKMNSVGLKSEPAYCSHITIEHSQKIYHAKAIFPASLHKEVSSYFFEKPLPEDLLHQSNLMLTFSLVGGSVYLSAALWETVSIGDFVILDHCHYNPQKQSGTLHLRLFNQNLFYVHIKNHQAKIVDYAFYEEDHTMDENQYEEHEDLASEEEEEDFEESFEEEQNLSDKLISAQDIPLDITVEVTKIKMPLKNILTLKPGNTLEISQTPETLVTLTVSGRSIGKGELIQLGDHIGVKITEIA